MTQTAVLQVLVSWIIIPSSMSHCNRFSIKLAVVTEEKPLGHLVNIPYEKPEKGSICVKLDRQGGHKPGKHGKPGKRWEFEKLSKSQGKLREI